MKYLEDAYVREFEATVTNVTDDGAILSHTYFYPVGGGQPHDEGTLVHDGKEYPVTMVRKTENGILHEVPAGLKVGDKIQGVIHWDRRYNLMRAHTAAHVLSSVIHRKTGALITGNQLSEGKIRVDYSLENFDPEAFIRSVAEANEELQKGHPVTGKTIPRSEAESMPLLSKLAAGLPKHIKEVRIVTIGDIDEQACAGTHVRSTKEIGSLSFLKSENKGKKNRRVHVSVENL